MRPKDEDGGIVNSVDQDQTTYLGGSSLIFNYTIFPESVRLSRYIPNYKQNFLFSHVTRSHRSGKSFGASKRMMKTTPDMTGE